MEDEEEEEGTSVIRYITALTKRSSHQTEGSRFSPCAPTSACVPSQTFWTLSYPEGLGYWQCIA